MTLSPSFRLSVSPSFTRRSWLATAADGFGSVCPSAQPVPHQLRFGDQARLKFLQSTGDIHAGVNHRQHDHAVCLIVADEEVVMDPIEEEICGKLRFQPKDVRLLLNAVQRRRDVVEIPIRRPTPPFLEGIALDGTQIVDCPMREF